MDLNYFPLKLQIPVRHLQEFPATFHSHTMELHTKNAPLLTVLANGVPRPLNTLRTTMVTALQTVPWKKVSTVSFTFSCKYIK